MPAERNDSFQAVAGRLRSAGSILVVTHARPDADALGSVAALDRAARAAGKRSQMLVPDGVPQRYAFLFPQELPATAQRFEELADAAELLAVIDTRATAQLSGIEQGILRRRDRIVVVDHHATGDDIADAQWVDQRASAAGVMVGELIDALGWPVDLAAAEALTIAVTSDTGWLRFSNTDGRTLRAVARWLDAGVRPDKLYKALYQNDRPQRLALLVRMLASLELLCDGRLAVMTLTLEDFDRTGALQDETENFVNEAFRLASVDTSVLLTEQSDCVRASLRSRELVDVAALARAFGGGGHARAAGLRAIEPLESVKRKLVDACREALRCD